MAQTYICTLRAFTHRTIPPRKIYSIPVFVPSAKGGVVRKNKAVVFPKNIGRSQLSANPPQCTVRGELFSRWTKEQRSNPERQRRVGVGEHLARAAVSNR